MKYKDYYAALGVPRDAALDQIKKAYRKLARQFHPDVSKAADAEARFKEAAEAYATLKDPDKRAAYDTLGQQPAGDEFTPPPQWRHEFDPNSQSFEGLDLADLLASLGRGRQGGSRTAMPSAGQDLDSPVRISLEDAHRGTTLTLTLKLADDGGERTLEVRIPPGVTEGQKVRLRGKGGKGLQGGPDGDIYLHISLLPHTLFRPAGHALYFDLALTPWEAALGAEVQVPTLEGPVVLTVPSGTQSARKLRLKGRGMADGRGGRGDLYATVSVQVPATLTPRERELFQELANTSSFNPRSRDTQENLNEHHVV